MDELRVVYRLPTPTGVTVSQPQRQAAALQDSDLYVEVERLDSYTHILPELTRLFTNGVKDPEMAQFLIALILTMVCPPCKPCALIPLPCCGQLRVTKLSCLSLFPSSPVVSKPQRWHRC